MIVKKLRGSESQVLSVMVGGKKVSTIHRDGSTLPIIFEFDFMTDAGIVKITDDSSENTYFDFMDDDQAIHQGFAKF